MKTIFKSNHIFIYFLILPFFIIGFINSKNHNKQIKHGSPNEWIKAIPKSSLNEEEKKGLILMREEEKMAFDVYNILDEVWKVKIFNNIKSSERFHTDAVKVLLNRYNIPDPINNKSIGKYTSKKLTQLYKNLVAQGKKSLLDAFLVGSTIEDLDINDLNLLLEKTDNEDIKLIYNYLNCGSQNHLRAFTRQIDREGSSYNPQYINKKMYDDIVNKQKSKECSVNGNNNKLDTWGSRSFGGKNKIKGQGGKWKVKSFGQ